MNYSQALLIAEKTVNSISQEIGFDLLISQDQTIEGKLGWMFFYNTSDYIRHGRASDALAGNGPIIVFRDGRIEEVPSSLTIEDACRLIFGEDRDALGCP